MELLKSLNELLPKEIDLRKVDYDLYDNVFNGLRLCCFQLDACCKNV